MNSTNLYRAVETGLKTSCNHVYLINREPILLNNTFVKKNNQRIPKLITSSLLLSFTENYTFHSQLSNISTNKYIHSPDIIIQFLIFAL